MATAFQVTYNTDEGHKYHSSNIAIAENEGVVREYYESQYPNSTIYVSTPPYISLDEAKRRGMPIIEL